MPEPLDPDAVMARHAGHHVCSALVWHPDREGKDGRRCLPYHLAADLAAERAKVRRVEAAAGKAKRAGDTGLLDDDYSIGRYDGLRDAASDVLAALAGEGAAEPQRKEVLNAEKRPSGR